MLKWLKGVFQQKNTLNIVTDADPAPKEHESLAVAAQKEEAKAAKKAEHPRLMMSAKGWEELPKITLSGGISVDLASPEYADKIKNMPADCVFTIRQFENEVKTNYHGPQDAYFQSKGELSLSVSDGEDFFIKTGGNVQIHSPKAMTYAQYDKHLRQKNMQQQVESVRQKSEQIKKREETGLAEQNNAQESYAKVEGKINLDEKKLPKLKLGQANLDLNSFAEEISGLQAGEKLLIGRSIEEADLHKSGSEFGIDEAGQKKIKIYSDMTVSRNHAVVSRDQNGQLCLTDISRNGVRVATMQDSVREEEGPMTTILKPEKETVSPKKEQGKKPERIYFSPSDGR